MAKDGKVRVGIIGVRNCASALVQGVTFYQNASDKDRVPGLMHVNLGGYHVKDIEFTAPFSYFMKTPTKQFKDEIACEKTEAFICGEEKTA